MFIGHFALGLAAKRITPRTSLGTLFAAPELADLLWPVFLLTGWERVTVVPGANPLLNLSFDAYPISHSLLALILWAAAFGALYRWRTGNARGATIVALLVASHWVLDWITHIPDLPLYPGGPKVGLGLWKSEVATVTIETIMFIAGLAIYLGVTRARDRIGRYGFFTLIVLLFASYVASLFSPPPVMPALAIGGIVFGWLFVVWGGWSDRHREALQDARTPGR